ncbi:BON domain-containing protein [Lutibacter flavus]|uniref:Osmotically-inducible protein OsmY, contains BON domain n=1 Tax=Lutibacter flavus TaxID=691689 RepID=A0A238XLA3_9FLAO|nr:BON domain-containing protein [Lutibacter flavus]SNR59243.1 Osmotically-inducible protein OsmY, contains BON domain [Lutibacter flavus]
MKSDSEIKEDVLDELMWQPNIDETQIGVIVEKGVVTLTGIVDTYSKKVAAEKAVKNVIGVKAVADDIEVKYGTAYKKTDKEIAKAVVNAFEWNSSVPKDKVKIEVRDGWVYLTGELQWFYQKEAARKAVENLLGVRKVINNITLEQAIKPTDIKEKIAKAFKRLADLDANQIKVEVDGHKVKLKGKVHSYAEKEEARKTAFFAPGVYDVENELEVAY